DASADAEGTYVLRLTATDTFGNSASDTLTFTWDTAPPAVSAFLLNDDDPVAPNNSLRASLNAADAANDITHCRPKYLLKPPAANDSCWTPVNAPNPGLTPAPSLAMTNYLYLIGYLPGTYTVYAWVRDRAGNRSELSDSGAGTDGQDRDAIDFQPGTPPVVSH